MRIGILTLPLHINYGGILQAYALQTVLERMGHEVVVYQKETGPRYKLPLWKRPLVYLKRIIIKLFRDKTQIIFLEKKCRKEFPLTRQYTNNFIQKYIHTVKIEKLNDIVLSEIDCIVVGSDQIWRPHYVRTIFKTDISEAFLKFAVKWKGLKIAYAASFGVDDWEYSPEQTKECKKLVQLFKAVSVREESGVKMCADYFCQQSTHVFDPTLLLNKADYIRLINKVNIPKSSGEMFCYILDDSDDKCEFVNMLSDRLKMKVYSMGLASYNAKDPLEKRIAQPVEKWIKCFYDAEFVVTDSFHGCLFSILFDKPFIAIGNKDRGMSRFVSLLSMLGFEKNLITNIKDDILPNINQEPYESDVILKEMREKSRVFLIEALGVN